jgi:hypothetical protein
LSVPELDRRTFLTTGLAAVPVFSSSSVSASRDVRPHSLDQRWMPHSKHVERVGEMQALRNLRDDLFPVTLNRFVTLGDDRIYKQSRHVRMADILADHYGVKSRSQQWAQQLEQPQSVFCLSTLLAVPKERPPVQDWWLQVSHSQKTNPQLSIVHVSSEDSLNHFGVTPSFTNLLLTRTNFRLHVHRDSIYRSFYRRRSLVKEVNRQIVNAMRTMPF